MEATQEQVRRALLDAHPYKIDTLVHVAGLAMEAGGGKKPEAKKIIRNAAKVDHKGHFGIKERAERVVARLDEVAVEGEEDPGE